jgi:hypothetical protein
LLDAYILQEDARHFKNLHLQENRLSRRYQQDLKELKTLQSERKKQEEEQEEAANGFAFTTPAEQSAGKVEIKINCQTDNLMLSHAGTARHELSSVLCP